MAQATPVGLPFSLLCESGQVYAAALAGPGVNSVVTLNPSGSNTPAWIIGSDNRIYYGSSIGPYCLDAFFPGWGTGGNTSRSGSFVFLNTVVPGSVTQLWQWETKRDDVVYFQHGTKQRLSPVRLVMVEQRWRGKRTESASSAVRLRLRQQPRRRWKFVLV
jgi:hypothetical protein